MVPPVNILIFGDFPWKQTIHLGRNVSSVPMIIPWSSHDPQDGAWVLGASGFAERTRNIFGSQNKKESSRKNEASMFIVFGYIWTYHISIWMYFQLFAT